VIASVSILSNSLEKKVAWLLDEGSWRHAIYSILQGQEIFVRDKKETAVFQN